MKEQLIIFLKYLGVYHFIQSSYRRFLFFLLNNYYRLAFLKYRGQGYTCNFCGSIYTKFVPEYPSKSIAGAINNNHVIAGFGENVYCPNCMCRNRDRLVLAVIENFIRFRDKNILHFSPEKHLYNFLKDKANVTTVDLMPGFYKSVDTKITYADATSLNYKNDSFDVVIANHILEHIPQDVKAMKELHRVLKKDGVAILQVPYSTRLEATLEEPFIKDVARQELLFGQKDHVRIYAFRDYTRRLGMAGFKVNVLAPESLLEFKKHAIQKGESVVLCYK